MRAQTTSEHVKQLRRNHHHILLSFRCHAPQALHYTLYCCHLATMPRFACNICNQFFEDTDAYTDHFEGNTLCSVGMVHARTNGDEANSRRSTHRRETAEAKRQKIANDIGSELAESRKAERQKKAQEEFDFSVFDFHGSDSDSQPEAPAPYEWRRNANQPKTSVEVPPKKAPTQPKLEEFREYCAKATQNHAALSSSMKAAIELMDLMNRKGGSLTLYKEIFQWHIDHLEATETVPQETLHKNLIKRYNLEDCLPFEHRVVLPSSKAEVNVTCHDAMAQIKDLLTDTRLSQDDYLFHDDDPSAAPPDDFFEVSDINTGEAYRVTYDKLIRPKQYTDCGRLRVLLPIIGYLDATTTGNFQNLPIEIFKITLGIFNRETRNKDWAWRKLGFVHKLVSGKAKGKEMISTSDHVDAPNYVKDRNYRRLVGTESASPVPDMDGNIYSKNNNKQLPTLHAQDLHKQLQVMFSSYKLIELNDGFAWDHVQENQRPLKLWYVPFFMFVKADGQEADKLCMQFTSKGKDVKCLCRYCTCPTQLSHDAYRDDPPKTKEMMVKMIQKNQKKKLTNISQHCGWNAFYELRFSLHNKLHIHGGVCMDPLHWIDIGQNGYTRDGFFFQTGEDSNLSKKINNMATAIGMLLSRQSDKNMPRTTFSKGIKKGKVMAHEMSGILLVLSATLRSAKGRTTILTEARGDQKKYFKEDKDIRNWIMFLETQLQFGAWLKMPSQKVENIERCKTKIREYMNMSKRVSQRQVGMGFNTMCHHGSKHAPQQWIHFGVSENVNTWSDEAGHKPDKKSAMRTNKQPDTWDIAIGKKIVEKTAVEYGLEEIIGRKKWHYHRGFFDHSDKKDKNKEHFEPTLTGVKVKVIRLHGDGEHYKIKVCSQMVGKQKYVYDITTRRGILHLLDYFSEYLESFNAYSELKVHDTRANKNTQIYRASAYEGGSPWHDWAIFDLTAEDPDDNFVPAHIKQFVDLRDLPEVNDLDFVPGIYALAEKASFNTDYMEFGWSELWESWIKAPSTVSGMPDNCSDMSLLNIDTIISPAVLIPDMGNRNPRAYLRLVPKTSWGNLFTKWLEQPHRREFDDPPDENNPMENAESHKK